MKQILPVVTILTLLTFIGTYNGFCEYSTPPIQYVPKDGNLIIEYHNKPINKIDLYGILSDTQNKEITMYAKRAKIGMYTWMIVLDAGLTAIVVPLVLYPIMKNDPESKSDAELELGMVGIGVVLSGVGLVIKRSSDRSLLFAIELYNNEYKR